jgi:hypothetical protein
MNLKLIKRDKLEEGGWGDSLKRISENWEVKNDTEFST